ncbi:hypothetical protein BN1095_1370001 [Clostridioides difficile]|uniref:Uncharacterized protein n=1 Tax=Clostridioides difficile TaxID=1496 RepID=A0A069AJK8_CLODI|nr:hypothetical protein BN1095_1370001 [Clostridioides difficile]
MKKHQPEECLLLLCVGKCVHKKTFRKGVQTAYRIEGMPSEIWEGWFIVRRAQTGVYAPMLQTRCLLCRNWRKDEWRCRRAV